MHTRPYLIFNGDCREAFDFYADVFRGEVTAISTFAGTPAESYVPPDWKDKVLHVELRYGDNVLYGSDAAGSNYQKPQGFGVAIVLADPPEAERIFNALAQGGNVGMPFAETFWAHRFGMVTDRFGQPWMVNCDKPA